MNENNNIAIKQLCFGLVNGDIPSKVEFYEGDFDGAVDAILTFKGGEINASGYGELDGSDFSLASAEITWNGQLAYVDESDPNAKILSKAILLAGKTDINRILSSDEGEVSESKNVVKINESQLHKIVAESVKNVVNEWRELSASEKEWRDIEREREDERRAREMDDLTAKSKMAKKWFGKEINETWGAMRPSESTLAKAKELYDYLYDAQEESDATRALYKMISDWLNEQMSGDETPSYIGG